MPADREAARRFRWLLDLPRGIQVAAGMALLIGRFGIQFEVTNPLMATRVFHLGSLGFGLLGTFMAAGGIVGNFYSSRRRDPDSAEFLAWAVLFGAAEAVAAVMPAVWAYDALMVVIGAAIQLFAVSAIVYVQKSAPSAARSCPERVQRGIHGIRPGGLVRRRGPGRVRGHPLGADRARRADPGLRDGHAGRREVAGCRRQAAIPPGVGWRGLSRRPLISIRHRLVTSGLLGLLRPCDYIGAQPIRTPMAARACCRAR